MKLRNAQGSMSKKKKKDTLRRTVANFLADCYFAHDCWFIAGSTMNVKEVIIDGHRGFMSLSEHQLIKEFYKAKEKVNSPEFRVNDDYAVDHLEDIDFDELEANGLNEDASTLLIKELRDRANFIEHEIIEKFLLLKS